MVVLHVDEDRTGANVTDRFTRSSECVWRGDDLVALTHTKSPQGEHQSVGAVADTDAVVDTTVTGKGFLEGTDLWSADEATGGNHVGQGSLHLLTDRGMLQGQVVHRHPQAGGRTWSGSHLFLTG